MKKIILIIFAIALLGGGNFYFRKDCNKSFEMEATDD